jgi:ferric-dicitrate binding protein FerR (iron transport regulator)
LEPGELASFDVNSHEIDISRYNRMDPYGWKDGRIVFHNATFHEVIEVLSRWYNVKFEVTGSLNRDWSYGSSFDNATLKNVLESLKFSEKIDYELNGSVVKLKL